MWLGTPIWWPVWVRAWAVSSVPAWFQANSGMNLFKLGEIVEGWLCGSIAQLAREFAWYGRGPGFESQSGCLLFPPL